MQMKNIQIEVTQQQYEIWERVMDEIDQTQFSWLACPMRNG
jgi:hypothetical protein